MIWSHDCHVVVARLQQSQKQNDQVYHELVPSLDTLEYAPGTRMSLLALTSDLCCIAPRCGAGQACCISTSRQEDEWIRHLC